jgi:hypothetical protein
VNGGESFLSEGTHPITFWGSAIICGMFGTIMILAFLFELWLMNSRPAKPGSIAFTTEGQRLLRYRRIIYLCSGVTLLVLGLALFLVGLLIGDMRWK